MDENELVREEPTAASEISNMGRKTVGVVSDAANIALGMGKKLNNRKKDKEEENKDDKKEKSGENSNDSNASNSLEDSTKSLAKTGGDIVKKGVKAAGSGLKKIWNLIPSPWNFVVLGGIVLLLLLFFVILIMGGASSSGCGKKYYNCSEITIEMSDGSIISVPFEEYVAGVVGSEAFTEQGMEALKAQAVASRTFAIVSTNDCTATIGSSTYFQVYKPTTDERAIQAVKETEGQVLTYDGKLFLSQYDSFCYADKDCPDAVLNNDGTHSVTYIRQPDLEEHKITLNGFSNSILNGQGHGHGMSQLVSYELASKGWDYEQILEYFYSDGVEIVSNNDIEHCGIGDSDALEFAMELDFEGDYWNYWANNTTRLGGKSLKKILGSDGMNDLNNYLTSQVESVSDPGEKVASIGMGLALYLYNEGYRIPYYWGGGHSYIASGADPTWGGSAYQTCSPGRCYSYSGLDCSGFVMWALSNAGCSYPSIIVSPNFSSFISRTPKRATLSDLKPGDLLMSEGHVILVVGYRKDLNRVITVESAGGTNGLVVRAYSSGNISAGSYYRLNMDSYYSNYCS